MCNSTEQGKSTPILFPDLTTQQDLLSGQVPLGFNKVVFAFSKHGE